MRAKKRQAAPHRTTEEYRLREQSARIRRELDLQRRVAQLSRQLADQATRTQERLFTLGRGLVIDQGWSVVDGVEQDETASEIRRLILRVHELERQLEEARAASGAGVV